MGRKVQAAEGRVLRCKSEDSDVTSEDSLEQQRRVLVKPKALPGVKRAILPAATSELVV